MSQTSPFGQPVDDVSAERPPVPTTAAPAEKSSRTALLAIGATAIALVAGVGGFFLLSGGSDEYPTGIDSPFPQSKAAASTPTPSTSPTPLPTESTVNARNPFLNAPSPAATPAAGGAQATAPAPTPSASLAPVVPALPAPTVTVSRPDVYVILDKIDAEDTATFKVISQNESGKKAWTVTPGHDFGAALGQSSVKPFTYEEASVKESGARCALVSYVDEAAVQVCKGDIVQVH